MFAEPDRPTESSDEIQILIFSHQARRHTQANRKEEHVQIDG